MHLSCIAIDSYIQVYKEDFFDEFSIGRKVPENQDKIFRRRNIQKQTNAGTLQSIESNFSLSKNLII